jgi:hypothetical protein
MTATVEAFVPLPYTFAPEASAMPAAPALAAMAGR